MEVRVSGWPDILDLTLISGPLHKVSWREQYEDFVMSEGDRRVAGRGAVAAAATEQWVAAADLSLVTTDAGYEMSHFDGFLGDRRIHGRFYRPDFKEGDYLEAVGHTGRNGTFEVVAVRCPAHRRIWLLRECERGHEAQRKHHWKWGFIISFILISLIAAALEGFEVFQQDEQLPKTLSFNLLMWGVVAIVTGAITAHFFMGMHKRTERYGRLATGIFKAFGYDNPESVDAKKTSSAIVARARREGRPVSVEVFSYLY
jgi:hypothetical protein